MSQSPSASPPEYVYDLVKMIDEAMQQPPYWRRQFSAALGFMKHSEEAECEMHSHRVHFFISSKMAYLAWAFDQETTNLWDQSVAEKKLNSADQEAFHQTRLAKGIELILNETGFDLTRPLNSQFAYFKISLRWFLLDVLRRARRAGKIIVLSMDDEETGYEPPIFDPDLTIPEKYAILRLAVDDLTVRDRDLAEEIMNGNDFKRALPPLRRALCVMRRRLRNLFLAHDLAQAEADREHLKDAADLVEDKDDAALIKGHYTEAGPECTPDLFRGLRLNILATEKERSDESGNLVRFRLARALNEIAPLLDPDMCKAAKNLPAEHSAILGFNSDAAGDIEIPSAQAMDPMKLELKRRLAARAMKSLHKLYVRAKDGKSLTEMLKHERLTDDERSFLEMHLRKMLPLEEMPRKPGVSLEQVRERLLMIAGTIIDKESKEENEKRTQPE